MNTATTKLRRVLSPTRAQASLLGTEEDARYYLLEGQRLVWVDADEALALLKAAEQSGRTSPEALPLLEQAAAYFNRGTFLDGEEGLWALGKRATIERARYRCRLWLAEAYEQQEMAGQAEVVLGALLEEDPTDEDALCRLMDLLHRQGMTHKALRLYEHTCETLTGEDMEPTEATTTLYERLKRAPRRLDPSQPSQPPARQDEQEPLSTALQQAESRPMLVGEGMPVQQTEPLLLFPDRVSRSAWTSRNDHQELNLLSTTPGSFYDGQEMGACLVLAAGDLAGLFEQRWAIEGVLDALRVTLQTIQDMPSVARQQLLRLNTAALMRDIALPNAATLSPQEQTRLCVSLGQNIAHSWKLFHTAKPSLTLAIAQAQLALVKQVHTLLYPTVRPFFYAALYQLIGAALYLLGSFEQAQHALEQSYLTGLQVANAWHMSQSLSWQAYLWQARGEPDHALDVLEQALHLISAREDPESLRLRARLFALEAEFLALVGDASGTRERLTASEALVASLREPHEEFDQVAWLQQAGICALYLHDYPLAIHRLERAFDELPSPWRLRAIATAIPLAKALTQAKQAGRTVEVIQKTLPLVASLQAPVFTQQFVTYLEQEVPQYFPDDQRCRQLVIEARQHLEKP